MESQTLISILVVHYRGASTLRDCLESMRPLVGPFCELVIVDNGSQEDLSWVTTDFANVKSVRSSRNLGFAGGNNLGINQCSGKYILLLNDDTIANAEFLSVLVGYLENHPRVGIVQGKMLLPRYDNTLDVCGSFLTKFGLPYHYGFYKPDGPKYQRSFPVFSGKGACLMFRRALIDHVGGFLFDPDFFCYYEETDFCHRSWLAGHEVHFVASPPIKHLMGGTSGSPQSSFVLTHYLRNMAFSLLSNLSFSYRLRILPLFFATLMGSMAAAACAFKWGQFAAHWTALSYCLTHYNKILKRRRLVKSIRRCSDQEIFAKVQRTPRLDYFVKTFTGQLGNYVDDELP
jgi:GT2 family glycosyltransferase